MLPVSLVDCPQGSLGLSGTNKFYSKCLPWYVTLKAENRECFSGTRTQAHGIITPAP